MGKNRRKEASVVFIGEESDTSPDPKTNNKIKLQTNRPKSARPRRPSIKHESLTYTFAKYLFSGNSVLLRLLSSLCPPIGKFKRIAVDYEGSFLSTFLLTVVIFWGLRNSKAEPRQIALLHAALLTSGYLSLLSLFTWLVSKATKTIITFRQIVSVIGYGLFGHACVLLVCEVGSNEWFLPLMTVIGGLDSVRICLILLARTPIPACRFVLCTPVSIVHLLYLVYLHFAIMKTE